MRLHCKAVATKATRVGWIAGHGFSTGSVASWHEPDHGLENEMPNHLPVNEPALSIQGIGGNCGR